MKVVLVSSTGGHFNALCQLSSFWQRHQCTWVTFRNSTTEKVLQGQPTFWAYGPTNRSLKNLVRNLLLSAQVLQQAKPDLVLSTGAGVAVPFLILAKLMGIKTAFLESFTRVEDLSLSARLALPFIDKLYVQWPQLQDKYPQAELITL
ncbi:PssD/Cps14F family polysaccharide biosynthesis glycosyltransferase [Synechocystis sp. LKSZ1]|uniref:PssD/Cps14F family polysaccharide biosynthesis glycosyltransferase n=1 Tax=Synechocystis sp. LKSZ1 TaxID=3144951 RepID=UPI00336BFA24